MFLFHLGRRGVFRRRKLTFRFFFAFPQSISLRLGAFPMILGLSWWGVWLPQFRPDLGQHLQGLGLQPGRFGVNPLGFQLFLGCRLDQLCLGDSSLGLQSSLTLYFVALFLC